MGAEESLPCSNVKTRQAVMMGAEAGFMQGFAAGDQGQRLATRFGEETEQFEIAAVGGNDFTSVIKGRFKVVDQDANALVAIA